LSLLEKAKQRLLKCHAPEEAPYIEHALQLIEYRAHDLGREPTSANYFIRSYENAKASEKDWELVEWYVKNPTSGDYRKKFNALILDAEAKSARTGKPFIDIFQALCQKPWWHEEGVS
jgi:hypothetical protein